MKLPPGNWFAPPGSNRSSSGGNKTVGAFGEEGRFGDLASVQAVTQVNAVQAPKQVSHVSADAFERDYGIRFQRDAAGKISYY